MATRTVADRPFSDLDVLDSGARDEGAEVDLLGLDDETSEQTDDALNPARGILLALLLSTPFWIAIGYWLIW
ncbi:MAG TPA: hypothetical protein VFB92_26355 [Vicinamibacterales bacterium]|jgi:hypothetical protein|nr:hypothetical protein [Vicinamibacterales bacterium]